MKKNYFDLISPSAYVASAVIAHETTLEMSTRMDWMALQPKVILDIGCGIGEGSVLLKKRYPDACILAMDESSAFLGYGKKTQIENIIWIQGDANQLPLKSYTVDLIFANLLLPWCDDVNTIFQEWGRVLKPSGLIMFTCLGPDTLQELAEPAKNFLLPNLTDMHNVGDAVLQSGFKEPVMDVQYISLKYQSNEQMRKELYDSGITTCVLPRLAHSVQNDMLTYEIVYGHAWGAGPVSGTNEVRVPVSALKK